MEVAPDARGVATAAPRGRSASAAFRPDIQGLRAIAVIAVVIYHAGLPLPGGYVGVDVFFVISGFLITTHLFSEISTTGRLDFGRFYARRARRILPASFVVLVGTLVASTFLLPNVLIRGVSEDAVASALYFPNMLFAWRGTNYLAETAPSPFQHYWSLGVEEQFYLLWPMLLVGLWFMLRHSRARLALATALVVVASLVGGYFATFASPSWAFFSLPTRAGELGIGALIAIAGPAAVRGIRRSWAAALGWCGLALIVASTVLVDGQTPFPGVAVLAPVLGSAAVIFFGQVAAPGGPESLLRGRPFQFFGAISYSLYLVHWPLMVIPKYSRGRLVELSDPAGIVLIGVATLLAWALYHWVEGPMRVLPALLRRRSRATLVWALAGSLAATGLAGCAVGLSSLRPTSSDRVATSTIDLTTFPVFTDFVPANLRPSLDAAADDIPALYPDGCHLGVDDSSVQNCVYGDTTSATDVVLFGDSHAAQWFPALESLALDHRFRLTVFTKSSCPSVDIPVVVDAVPYASCDTWRAGVIARIGEIQPDLIVLSNLADYGEQIPSATDDSWSRGLSTVIRSLPKASRVAVFADTPSFTETPAICLSANLESADYCALPRDLALRADRAGAERRSAESNSASYFDFNDSICDADTCGVIIGSTLVYRDANHLTATFARELAPAVWDRIAPLLVADSPVPTPH